MKYLSILTMIVAAFAVSAVAVAGAVKPPKPPKPPTGNPPPGNVDLSIAAKPNPIVFGQSTTISGQLKSGGGQSVVVEENPYPFTGGFKPVKLIATDSGGKYSLALLPKVSTRYRVSSQASPAVRSPELLVQVQIRVSLRLSDSTPRAGSRVRFSGSAAPAHDGRVVEIQRLRSGGGYGTVARTPLRDAGSTRSVYSRRIRVSRTGTFRARIQGDGDHATGFSAPRTARVH